VDDDELERERAARENDRLAEELAEGALDPDEVPWAEPWDEGADDET
jgi:hypothetical protein